MKVKRMVSRDNLVSAVVESETVPGVEYSVVIDFDRGEASCTCPGFAAHRRCKHVRALAEEALRAGLVERPKYLALIRVML